MVLRFIARSISFAKQPISRSFLTSTSPLRSFIPTMPPRRKATAQATVPAGPIAVIPSSSDIPTAAFSTSPIPEVKPSLLQALEHIPPMVAPGPPSDTSDLTPPPTTQDTAVKAEGNGVNGELPTPPLTDSQEEATTTPVKPKRGRKTATTTAEDQPTPNKRTPRASKVKAETTDTLEEPPKVTPRKRTKKAISSDEESEFNDNDDSDAGTVASAPSGKPGKEAKPKEKKEKKKTPKKSRIAKDEPEYDSEGNEIPKKKRKEKVYEKVIYDIPEVEKKSTTFKGRLGYACLNTVLRNIKPARDSIFCSRTCRIASILEEGLDLPKQLAMLNLKDLLKMIQWNEDNKIRFMRLSSEMFPFASHDKYGYSLEYAAAELKEAGDLAKSYGHRLTMHPGQFTQIGSPKPAVVRASIRELEYQCEIMDRMGLDQDGVMIIHMGGVYGDKPSTLARFKENYLTLGDHIKRRLVLENDEICYNVDDLLPTCQELDIPMIFDYHHDWINPSCEPPGVLIPKINEIWAKKGIRVKQHLSEPRPGAESVMERRAHADRCKNLPPDLPDDVDLMIEAKDKEQAVFELYRMYGLEDVIHDNLRPPDPEPSMRTKGRKSSLKKKVKETGEVDSDGEPVELSDVEKEGDGGVGDEGLVENREVDVDGEPKEEVEEKVKPKRGRRPKAAEAKVEEPQEVTETVKGVEDVKMAEPAAEKPKRGRKKKVEQV